MSEITFHGYTPIASGNQIFLERPRIFRLLEKAARFPIINIVAGAGFGKTFAVYSYVKKYNIRTAWIQCSEGDNTGEFFWENFVSAFSAVSEDTAKKLKRLGFPAGKNQLDKYLEISGSGRIPDRKIFFVYDDLHLISDKAVLNFLELSLSAAFLNPVFVLISRKEPVLNLERVKAKKLVAGISGDELCFSKNEMVSFFKLRQLTPPPRAASYIYHETEGWAFAIQLASLSLKNSSSAAYIPQALRSNAFKLIESEIMAALSPALRRFLIKLSLVENLNPDLLKEIGRDPALLGEMEGIASFIYFDDDSNSYRIHRLFIDYLRERQNELSPEEKNDVWNKAAAWAAANDQQTDAIIYHEKAGNYDAIVNIFNSLPMILPAQTARLILDTLDRAPGKIHSDFSETVVIRFRALASLGLFEQSRTETLEAIPKLMAMPESSQKHRSLRACYLNLGFIGFFRVVYTKRYDFMEFFKKAEIENEKTDHETKTPVNGIILSSYACRIMAPASKEDIEKYIAAMGEIVPCTVKTMGGCQAGLYELALGEYAFFRGLLDEAEKYLLESIVKAREKQQYEVKHRSLFYLLRIHLYRGKAPEKVLTLLERELEEPSYLNRYFYHDIFTGWFYIQTGQNERLAFWLKSDYEESGLNSSALSLERLVKAKYCFSEKRYPAALAAMENRGDMGILLFGDIEMKALEAVCRYRLRDREGAFAALSAAYAIAAPADLFMPFWELGKDMRTLAEAARKEAAAGNEAFPGGLPREWLEETCRKAAAYAKKNNKRYLMPEKNSPVLSRREKEVLSGFSQGLTREEIACAASISPNTVKSVARSVFSKLGALNQADAVRIAAEKGIFG